MSREIDHRDFNINKVTPARRAEMNRAASEVSDRLPGEHRVRVLSCDATTGNPAVVVSENSLADTGNYVQRALHHMKTIKSVLGFAATQSAEFTADHHVQRASSGAVAVYLHQRYKGIPIFQAANTVRFAPDGDLKESAGKSITVDQDLDPLPKLSAREAVLKAAQHVAVPHADEQGATDQFGEAVYLSNVELTDFKPKVTATFPNKPELPTVFEAGPFGDSIKCSLTWFPLDNNLRLVWEVTIAMPKYEGQYHTYSSRY